ncbi:hypothetical protein FH972_025859 [Carpinus fangiana]|uniref:Hyaluronan/mRNA-binding protein domain-containing protein n=1 Tax=Carpinus fangiana TaxID=176857 RepID=A0A5N6L2N1_9ROSI|nr:hypothetical protein FH972_025859 [Carpinus fangiana]
MAAPPTSRVRQEATHRRHMGHQSQWQMLLLRHERSGGSRQPVGQSRPAPATDDVRPVAKRRVPDRFRPPHATLTPLRDSIQATKLAALPDSPTSDKAPPRCVACCLIPGTNHEVSSPRADATQTFRFDILRTHKYNERDHHHPGSVPEEHLPKFFAKSGYVDVAPGKTKKDGGGKGNWGRSGDEILDEDFNVKPRRRSNSSVEHGPRPFQTKFEIHEPEPVFEEESMGPNATDLEGLEHDDNSSTSDTMSKTDTNDSVVESEGVAK